MRTLVNIGLAHNNKFDYLEGAQYFMTALCLNPQAKHIWNYFRQSVLQSDRFDLLDKIDAQDPKLFAKDFKLITHKELGMPNMDNLYKSKIFLGKK